MKYEYVRVQVDKNNRAMNADMESHREIIDRTATAGARYVAWLPVTQAIQARPWSSTWFAKWRSMRQDGLIACLHERNGANMSIADNMLTTRMAAGRTQGLALVKEADFMAGTEAVMAAARRIAR